MCVDETGKKGAIPDPAFHALVNCIPCFLEVPTSIAELRVLLHVLVCARGVLSGEYDFSGRKGAGLSSHGLESCMKLLGHAGRR